MNKVLSPFWLKFVLVFFDDILILRKKWKEHVNHVVEVLNFIKEHKFFAKKSKCFFGKKEIEYLGHLISKEGIKVDLGKVKVIQEWPIPKNITKLRGFLGLIGYYRRFVKSYVQKTTPLTRLLKKDSFQWNEEVTTCFEQLKWTMTSLPALISIDFSKIFTIECDVSGIVIGATLMQEGKLIAFESRKLNNRKQLKST